MAESAVGGPRAGLGNPYVGPRPFQENETIYGREEDCEQLLRLLVGERIVLLHSPSGAGKSSLINAALVPALRRKNFSPQTVRMVGGPGRASDPQGALQQVRAYLAQVSGAARESSDTPIRRVLSCWNAALPEDRRLPESDLAEKQIPDFGRRVLGGEQFPVLILDQFEGVFTGDCDAPESAQELFSQLGELLSDRGLWVLFAMREDYLGALEPYCEYVSGGLRARYRLELLGPEQAADAVRLPAQSRGVVFAKEYADELVKRLRLSAPAPGSPARLCRCVEPVLLQVVCTDLWERKPAEATEIAPSLIPGADHINSAIGDFYARVIREVAAKTGAEEAPLRAWCGNDLIQGQLRAQVRHGPTRSELDQAILKEFEDRYLIRPDTRGDTTWYELVHDRLVEAILENNRRWELELPKGDLLLSSAASCWQSNNESDYYLLRGRGLRDAEEWAAAHQSRLTLPDHKFLDRCRKERRTATTQRIMTAVMTLLIVVAVFFILRFVADQKSALADRKSAIAARKSAVAAQELARAAQKRADAAWQTAGLATAQAARQGEIADQHKRTAEEARKEASHQQQQAAAALQALREAQAAREEAEQKQGQCRQELEQTTAGLTVCQRELNQATRTAH